LSAARILFSALLVYLVCTAAGQILLDRLKLRLERAEARFLAFLAGSACVSTIIFFLAILRRVYPAVLLVLAAAVLIARVTLVRTQYPAAKPDLDRRWKIAFRVVYIVFGIYYLCNAMAPETSSDGAVYHVGLAARYFERHGFYPIRTNIFANMPIGIEMLFLFAYSFGRHSGASMVHLLFLLTLPFGMIAYARRMGQPLAGLAGALLFYVAPIVGKDGSVAYNDVATAAVIFGCFYAVQIWYQDRHAAVFAACDENRGQTDLSTVGTRSLPVTGSRSGTDACAAGSRHGLLVLAGLLAGFAFVCKYTAVTALIYAGGFVLMACFRRREKPWRALAAVALPAALLILPWMIKSAVYVGNPVHPFFSAFFPDRYFAERLEQDYRAFLAHPNGITYAQVPWQATTGGALDGILGPIFLLAPIALLSLRLAMGRQVLAAYAVFMLTYPGNLGARFLIPPLPFLALALAAAIAARPPALAAVVAAHLLLSWPPLMRVWAPSGQWRLDEFDWRAALRITPEDRYLALHMTEYRPGLMLDRFVPRGQLVYAPSVGQIAYHHTETIGSNLSMNVLDLIATGYMPGRDTMLRRRYTFAPVRTQVLRLVLEAAGDLPWKIGELRLDIPRDPRWRIAASSNPWDVGLAFDSSLVSAWVSGKRAQPGLWVQVDFGEPTDVSSVTVEQLPDQRHLAHAVEALVKGRFVRIPAAESIEERPFGRGLRRAAAAEIKARGVSWLLLRTGDYGEEDLRLRAPYWGAHLVSREGDFYLWKLD